MALSKREKEIIDSIIDRQIQLENLIVGRISPLARLGMEVTRRDPFDSPFVISEKEHRSMSKKAASAGKRAGQAKRRKVSAYQKAVGKALKDLKKKHPRTPVTKLMKRAHRAAKRSMK